FNLPEAKQLRYDYDAEGRVIWHSRSNTDEELHYLPFSDGNHIEFLLICYRHCTEYYVYDVEVQLSGEQSLPLSFVTMLPTSEFAGLQQDFSQRLRLWLGGGLLVLLGMLWLALTWSLGSLRGVRRELQEIESGGREHLSDQH